MTVVLMAYVAVGVGVALWCAFPVERAHRTGALKAVTLGALWPLLVLCLAAFAAVCWACPEPRPRQDGSPAEPGGRRPEPRRPAALGAVEADAGLPVELG
jgi:hypothetical protein